MKQIEGFEGYYVTEQGDIYTTKKFKVATKIKPQSFTKSDYKFVTLTKDGKRHHKLIHRLVAQSFIANPDNKPQVCHLNHNPSDNRVENLVWGTHKENMSMSVADGRFLGIPMNTRGKIKGLYQTGKYSQKQIASMFGIDQASVSIIVREERL